VELHGRIPGGAPKAGFTGGLPRAAQTPHDKTPAIATGSEEL
jgi:hypothetical protein